MNAIELHQSITAQYDAYLRSFFPPMDEKMKAEVEKAMASGRFIPEPLLQFNPSSEAARNWDLIAEGAYRGRDEKSVRRHQVVRPSGRGYRYGH